MTELKKTKEDVLIAGVVLAINVILWLFAVLVLMLAFIGALVAGFSAAHVLRVWGY